MNWRNQYSESAALCLAAFISCLLSLVSSNNATAQYVEGASYETIESLFEDHCYDCHGGGAEEGGIALDDLLALEDREAAKHVWHRAFKQIQANQMPPADQPQLDVDDRHQLMDAIKFGAFELDRDNPHPGRVTIRRLNRIEYENTIRDLIGVEFKASQNFPEDDSGHGFDNMSDVLTISPLLLEKYLNAANEIVSSVVPTSPLIKAENYIAGAKFELLRDSQPSDDPSNDDDSNSDEPEEPESSVLLSYYEPSHRKATVKIEHPGNYELRLSMECQESYVDNQFDDNKCEFTFLVDGKEFLQREFVRQGGKEFVFNFEQTLTEGDHEFEVIVKPLSSEKQVRNLRIELYSLTLLGPDDEKFLVKPRGHERFFPRPVPDDNEARRKYARELLAPFATKAFRRPVDDETLDRLVGLAESIYKSEGQTFEAGIAKSMTATLASSRFLFREEAQQASKSTEADKFPFIDEYSLASRLSYFFWSTMPDQELIELASQNKLRENLDDQVARMLAHDKAESFTRNYVGQWLKSRAIESIPINERSIVNRELPHDPEREKMMLRFRELLRMDELTDEQEEEIRELRQDFRNRRKNRPKIDLNWRIRSAMRRETEMLFDHILKNDLSVLELINSDYTFLNETLADHYKIPNLEKVEGRQMRLVKLPPNSLRGGILTQGTMLITTSNPDRTSPVKRGLFILENLLGIPIPAPPPNIPSLEDAQDDSPDAEKLSMRESMKIHRADPLCNSCHRQMDAFGLALDNFNAVGRYRESEYGVEIDTTAELDSGEKLDSVRALKKFLVETRTEDIYRCFTEKMLMYALGREVDYRDVQTIDTIVEDLKANKGKASFLIDGIIHSAAFQQMSDE